MLGRIQMCVKELFILFLTNLLDKVLWKVYDESS
jgi:hypothetical protein